MIFEAHEKDENILLKLLHLPGFFLFNFFKPLITVYH